MAAALFRRGPGLCVRCIHRELCRLVWRPQTAQFSSKPSDRKPPRKTHIKKAKPQPAVDVAKLLEQLYSQRRPGTKSPAAKARPAQASSTPTKSSDSSSTKVSTTSSVPPSSKTAASVFSSASSLPEKKTAPLSTQPEPASPTNPKTSPGFEQAFTADGVSNATVAATSTSASPPTSTTPAPVAPTETIDSKVATEPALSSSSPPAAAEETLIETAIETPAEAGRPPVEALETRAAVGGGPVEPTVDVAAEEVRTESIDSGLIDASATVEPLVETTSVEASVSTLETQESAAAVPVEALAEEVQTKSSGSGGFNLLHTAKEEPSIETTIESTVEASTSTLENRAAVPESTVEEVHDSGAVDVSRTAAVEAIIETTIEPSVEAHTSVLGILESRADFVERTDEVRTRSSSTDSGVFDFTQTVKVEPLIETAVESSVETSRSPLESRAAVAEGPAEPTIETGADKILSHAALARIVQESAVLPLKHEIEPAVESTVETTVESHVAVADGANVSEEMNLESVTLNPAKVFLESLKTDELLQTKSALDEEAGKRLRELPLPVQTGIGGKSKAASETAESSTETESEILTEALSKWESLSEDLRELEGETGVLVTELLCHVPAMLSDTSTKVATTTSSDFHATASEPPAGANRGLSEEEKPSKEEAMTLESITLADVRAGVGNLELKVLQEMKDALENEADALSKEEKMEVKTEKEDVVGFEDTIEVELYSLESISEATDALEAETSVILESMFGSEQGLKQPSDALLIDKKQDETIVQEVEKESRERDGSVVEAMSLESVTLAEIEASLRALEGESLKETSAYLEEEAEILAGEKKVEVEDGAASEEMTEALKIESLSEADVRSKEEKMELVTDFKDTIEVELYSLESISEATDALEAETSVILESMFGSEQGLKQPSDALLIDKKQDEVEKESRERDSSVVEAMSLESVTLAEIEASLRALEGESLKETSAYLEEEAKILAVEKKVEVEDGAASEEMTEALTVESLSLPEADAFPEALQTDALMQELLFSVPGRVAGLRESQTGQEVEREKNILDATVATRSGVADTVAPDTDDLSAPPAQKEVLGQEEEDGATPEPLEIQKDLDPVQRLFLEKIREYNDMCRLSGEPAEMEPDYEKSLSEETAKLQRLYGGGDLNSFPQFTFTEPTMDKDSE